MPKWIEISADYRCNNRCLGCFSSSGSDAAMTTREVKRSLEMGRRTGADSLWLGGGEPTLRRDLFVLVRMARRLGYQTIKLQTNGLRLAYPEYTARCHQAGITEVNFAIKGHTAALHDGLTRTPGSHDLLTRAIAEARKHDLSLAGDILVYRRNVALLPEMIRDYTTRGIERFNIWLLSTSDQGESALRHHVPPIREVVSCVTAAMALELSSRPDFITSLHTPPCTVPERYWACLFSAAELDLLVINPGGYSFRLEESPFEGGTFLPRCEGCRVRQRCDGIRADYIAIYGDEEFQPLS